jgi:hypothetical protein
MRFADTLGGLSSASREAYATSKAWTLPWTTWSKTVYAQFDANNDWISDVETSDDIDYVDSVQQAPCPVGATCWTLSLEIKKWCSYCEYWKTLDMGITGYSFSVRDITTWHFLTENGNQAWFCEDKIWRNDWNLQIQATNLYNTYTNNVNHFISSSDIFVKSPNATLDMGACIPYVWDINDTWTSLSWARIILGKLWNYWEACKIKTNSVDIKVKIPAAQAVWQYSGTITITTPNFPACPGS